MKRLGCFFLAVCVAIPALASLSLAADKIKVGIVDTYTGPASYFTLDVLDGFKFAVDKINAKGGVLGKKIEYLIRDDKFQPDLGLTMAKELVLKEDVDVLVGTINTSIALAISDLAKKEKVPFFSTRSKGSTITDEKGHRYVFQMTDNVDMSCTVAGTALAKKPFVKYWVAGDDYELGHNLADAVWKQLKTMNPKAQLVGQSWWKMGETDYTPYITQILAAKPDLVIGALAASSVAGFQKSALATGLIQKTPLYVIMAIEHGVIMSQGKDAPAGVYGTASYLWYYPDTPANKAFVAEYYQRYKKYPTESSLDGYMTAQFIAEGFKKAGKIDKEAFINALEVLRVDSPIGPLSIRACDHQTEYPIYFGRTKKDPKYDFLVAEDIVTVPAKDAMLTCEEVMKRRQK